jgi:hypothetical protein
MRSLKRITFFLVGLANTLIISAQQQTADLGLFAGGAIPFSDYSNINLIRSVNFNAGGYYRYNFNSRYALRINGLYGIVGANGHLDDLNKPISFRKPVIDLGAFFEVNYLDFLLGVDNMKFSPYVFTGIGVSFYSGANGSMVIAGNIPLGIGVKYALTKRLGMGAEISTRKLLNDELDNLDNPYSSLNLPKVNDIFHNNDWVNYFGLTLTYKFFMGKKPCPAYNSLYD